MMSFLSNSNNSEEAFEVSVQAGPHQPRHATPTSRYARCWVTRPTVYTHTRTHVFISVVRLLVHLCANERYLAIHYTESPLGHNYHCTTIRLHKNKTNKHAHTHTHTHTHTCKNKQPSNEKRKLHKK